MRYILDTNILIAYLNNDIDIVERVLSIEETNISWISLGELYYGATKSLKKAKNINNVNIILKNSN